MASIRFRMPLILRDPHSYENVILIPVASCLLAAAPFLDTEHHTSVFNGGVLKQLSSTTSTAAACGSILQLSILLSLRTYKLLRVHSTMSQAIQFINSIPYPIYLHCALRGCYFNKSGKSKWGFDILSFSEAVCIHWRFETRSADLSIYA